MTYCDLVLKFIKDHCSEKKCEPTDLNAVIDKIKAEVSKLKLPWPENYSEFIPNYIESYLKSLEDPSTDYTPYHYRLGSTSFSKYLTKNDICCLIYFFAQHCLKP